MVPDQPVQPQAELAPGRYYGVKKVLTWHLHHSVSIGGCFTVEQLEHWVQASQIEQGKPGKRVEVDRRLRELREIGYVINSHLNDPVLPQNQYRLVRRGERLWER